MYEKQFLPYEQASSKHKEIPFKKMFSTVSSPIPCRRINQMSYLSFVIINQMYTHTKKKLLKIYNPLPLYDTVNTHLKSHRRMLNQKSSNGNKSNSTCLFHNIYNVYVYKRQQKKKVTMLLFLFSERWYACTLYQRSVNGPKFLCMNFL